MGKIIKLTESDLIHIVHKVLKEQSVIGAPNYGTISPNTTKPKPVTPKGFECVPKLFAPPVAELKNKGYNPLFLKTALGIIGRESSFGTGNRFDYLNPLKTLWASLGGSTSVGYGQIKPETAKEYGMNIDDLNTALGSLTTVYNILMNNFKKARQVGYSGSPSAVKNGTGNAALDMAILAYNAGEGKIVKYCETSNPKIKRNCKYAGKLIEEQLNEQGSADINMDRYNRQQLTAAKESSKNKIKVYNKPVADYIPNFKTNRWDGVEISSHGYIQEVADKIKKYTCFS
jgi:hypothetical protein